MRREIEATRAIVAAMQVLALVAALLWVTLGRLDATWPIRNVAEQRARGLALQWLAYATPEDPRPLGSIVGRVTWRASDASTTPSPTSATPTVQGPSSTTSLLPNQTGVSTPGPTTTAGLLSTTDRADREATQRDLRNVPLADASVVVVDADGNTVEARTDQAGEYALSNLYPGRYRVVAAAPGFAPTIVDRMPDASPMARLLAWALPGVTVPTNAAATLHIVLERPSPPALSAFARDVLIPDALDPATPSELVGCPEAPETPPLASATQPPLARRLPIRLTGAVADAPVASLRRYAPIQPAPSSPPASGAPSREPGVASRDAGARVGDTGKVVAVVPVGSEEDGCAAISLAARGVEVVVAGIAPDGRLERQVLAVRSLIAALRGDSGRQGSPSAPREGAATSEVSDLSAPTERASRGPIVVAAGWASAIVMRAVSDEASDIPMDWSGVPLLGRAPPGSAAAERMDQRRAAVRRRIAGVVLLAPVLDLFAARREAASGAWPPWLAEAVTALGPADRELPRYLRYSARFAADSALPSVVVVRGGSQEPALNAAIDDWIEMLGRAGVSANAMAVGEVAPWADADPNANGDVTRDYAGALAAVVSRVAAMAGSPS